MWLSKNGVPQHLPEATGPFVPGCMDVMLDYVKEGIFMRLYYPTNHKRGDPTVYQRWIPWVPDDSYVTGIAKVLMSYPFVIKLAFWWWGHKSIPAVYGAKPKTDQKLKCIVLSHGLGGNRCLNSQVCTELASRGLLVAALEHRDHSSSYTYFYKNQDDARRKLRTPVMYKRIEFGKDHFPKRKEQVQYRAEECSKAVDFLIGLNGGKVPHNVTTDEPTERTIEFSLSDLVGNLDLDHLVMSGHSFGGASALLTLHRRTELKLGILLDPWMFPIKEDKLYEKVEQPLLFINTQTFHIATSVDAMSKYLTGDTREMYTLLHTTHEHQTDSIFLVGSWLNWFMKKLDPVVAMRINNYLILQYLDKYIGCPTNIEDCKKFLSEQKESVESGLTKPWA